MSSTRLQHFITNSLPYIFVFIASLYRPSDADLGWHLKYGEYFFKHFSFLRVNTFSTEMPGYLWANTSWLTDLISYSIYSMGGFFALTLAGALVVAATFFIFSKAYRVTYWQQALIFPLLLYLIEPINMVSFRGQLMSLGLLGVLLYLLFRYERLKDKTLYIVPILFLFWTNLHGQFILGLGIYGIWVVSFLVSLYFKDKKNKELLFKEGKRLFFVSLLTFLATLVHPFGLGVYKDAITHFNNPLLKSIVEYLPPEELSTTWWNYVLIGVLLTIGAIALFMQKKWYVLLTTTSITAILFALSLYVKRYSWSMYYTVIPFLQPVADFLKPDSKKMTFIAATVLFAIYTSILIVFKSPLSQFTSMSWETYCKEYIGCSSGAVEYLLAHKPDGKMMTMYNWGGWMIWNYPGIKPSIDGRMHLWKDEKGYSAFETYYNYEQNFSDIEDSDIDVVLMSPTKPIFRHLANLVEKGQWQVAYQDPYAVVFVRR